MKIRDLLSIFKKIENKWKDLFFNGNLGDWSEECFDTEKISEKNEQKFIFQFLLKIEIGIWNSFFDLIMKTKNEKNSKFYFILKRKSNVPFNPRIWNKFLCLNFGFVSDLNFEFRLSNMIFIFWISLGFTTQTSISLTLIK